jgi:hypothetical protein
VLEPGGTVKSDSELLALGIDAVEVSIAPVLILANQFDV